MRTVFAVLSFLFSLAAYFPYIIKVWKTRHTQNPVRPQRATWFVWEIVDACMAWALLSAGELAAGWMFVAFATGSLIVLILSFPYGEGGFTALDLICVSFALVGVYIWRSQDGANPMMSVVANMAAATIGTVPQIRKIYLAPHLDDPFTWKLFVIGGLFNTLAISEFTFLAAGPTIVVFLLQIAINLAFVFGRRREERRLLSPDPQGGIWL
jgi:hypothetical protein